MDFKLHLLETITNNFSDEHKVASGGYADVYRGVYNGEEIAVKRLHQLKGLDDRAFQNEVRNLWKVRHHNVVRLIGYCYDTHHKFVEHEGELVFAKEMERVLCFEYMQGGSLDQYISGDVSCDLDWPTCYKIINATCDGLNHLHNAQERPIFHLDLKPANILLDEDMMAKIAGFDISRQVDHTNIDVRTETRMGTMAYMPPEYKYNGRISKKFDVFSLGVTIINIMAGYAAFSRYSEMSQEQFSEFVAEKWKERLQGTSTSQDIEIIQVETCAEIALRCVEDDPHRRPSIKEITNDLKELESEIVGMSRSSHWLKNLLARRKTKKKQGKRSNEPTSLLQYDEGVKTEDVHKELKILECILGGSMNPSNLKLPTLQYITKKFSRDLKIGNGGCAEVYKLKQGILQNGIIAVKRLYSNRTIEDKMFHQEVKSLMMVNHKNVVRFLGYCSHTEEQAFKSGEGKFLMAETRERLLCFEYMTNGSLENYLTDELRGPEWLTRYEIIKGICDGLYHLHINHVIHMDLKPANILLDNNMVPKINDFGLSRFDDRSQTQSSDRLLSLGYCAPEYQHDGKMSSKSDIYSLGVIIQELVTGSRKKPNITKVHRRWRHRWNKSGKDAQLGYKQVANCLDLARRCTQMDPTDRPNIWGIISDLNEMDSSDVDLSDATECLKLEDMLGIEPLEIYLPFELNKQISCSVDLTNDTDDHFAFRIATTSLRPYRIEANNGTLPPRSKSSVTITLQALEKAPPDDRCRDEFSVQSTRVDGSLTVMDIGGGIFREEPGKVVDTVNLTVVLSEASSSSS
ncbi:hypothetical protein U9M48_041968 [Paspalum notatum var. saurae]|uniref:Uncharacterized protein n=1 Tax=Paspalum notatum var. saurae TaxID=547442 RepID=A0AAQ3XES2_PASNO